MIRYLALTTVGLLTACSASSDGFAYRSTLDIATRGLALHADGESGHAGMFQTNCPFDTTSGNVTGDFDLPGEGEEVQDAGPSILGDDSVLLVLDQQIHLLHKDSGAYDHTALDLPGVVVQARLADGGVVAAVDDGRGCALLWERDGEVRASVAAEACGDAALDVHPRTGVVALADGAEVTLIHPEATLALGVSADRVAWDEQAEALYVASAGDDLLSAFDPDGASRWSVELPGPVHAVSHAGRRGAAAVVVALDDGRGSLMYLDGRTGDVRAEAITPEPADGITVSADGRTVALTVGDAAHFYRISTAWAH